MLGADKRSTIEIERKFLLRDPSVVFGLAGRLLVQGYLGHVDGWQLRIRLAGKQAWITLKSETPGRSRAEREMPLPAELAMALLASLPESRKIEKIRYMLPGPDGLVWEIDQFLGRHEGLWLAEIELDHPEHPLDLPLWLGAEVTDDPAYRNASLAQAPPGNALPEPALGPYLADLLALDSAGEHAITPA